MRRRAAAAAFAVLLSVAFVPVVRAASLPALHWDGHWLRDPSGRAVVLHGLNAVAKTGDYLPVGTGTTITPDSLNDADAALIAQLGFNVVRLGLIWKAVEPQRGVFDQDYIDRAKHIVDVLASHGIYTLLDFHQDVFNERYAGEGAPDWAVQSPLPATNTGTWMVNYFTPAVSNEFDLFWANAGGVQDEFANAWSFVAQSFNDERAVMGYDLFNEPWPGTQWPTCANPQGCPLFDQLLLQPFFQKVIDAVRRADPTHIVFWEPNVTADFGAAINVGQIWDGTMPPDVPQVGISFHDYCLEGAANQNPGDGATCPSLEQRSMDNGVAAAETNGVAPLLSEFGATDDLTDIARIADMADAAGVGWAYWAYKHYEDPTGGPDESLVTFDEAGDFIVKPKAEVIARPYPQAIAGQPAMWRWDVAMGTLTVIYDSVPSLSDTRIAWPSIQGNYNIGVACQTAIDGPCTDVHVTSALGSNEITVAADVATRVIVAITKR